ncbi:MAG: hypothetical protein OXK82_05715 [Deltaproteobacteria bacterium]|nr:hypothetical protein [Deltaproteobacteria bacterium]
MNFATMVIAFVADVQEPVLELIRIGSFIAGMGLLALTAWRVLEQCDSFDRDAPPGLGTTVTFVAGIVLLHLPSWFDAVTLRSSVPAVSTPPRS